MRFSNETQYNWVAFVPQRESDAGALMKYFRKVASEDEFKIQGIEARQRSTPPFIEEVLSSLQDAIERLHGGLVPVEKLVKRNQVSKPLEGYTQNTQNVAALKRDRD
jgi:DNA polymerase I